jgi:hypothetical protein
MLCVLRRLNLYSLNHSAPNFYTYSGSHWDASKAFTTAGTENAEMAQRLACFSTLCDCSLFSVPAVVSLIFELHSTANRYSYIS